MLFVPSPVALQFNFIYSATSNASGRMQYHRIKPGHSKVRISRTEFIKAYNDLPIIALKPIQQGNQDVIFQFEFYV